jgi:hypothetical protein
VETAHYLKTELEHVSVNDLDGELQTEFAEKNLLREKTFNNELNALVNKIFINERIGQEPSSMKEELPPSEKNALLEQCEKLIYQLKHIDDLHGLSSIYNPFDADINIYDDIDDTADYVKAGLIQGGYEHYQILKYSFRDKAYRSDINLLDSSYSADMYFSISDPLIIRINKDPAGCILDQDMIDSDPFLSKKFDNSDCDHKTQGSYYIVKIASLFEDSFFKEKFDSSTGNFDKFLSPLLLIEVNRDITLKPFEIFANLKLNASIPLLLYFLKNRIRFNISNYSYEDTLLMMELFVMSMIDSRLTGYIITLKKYTEKNNIFILKFLLSRLRRLLKKDSLILRISINTVILFSASAEVDSIGEIVERINTGEGIISIEPVDYNEYLDSKEFAHLFL